MGEEQAQAVGRTGSRKADKASWGFRGSRPCQRGEERRPQAGLVLPADPASLWARA